MSEIKEIIFIKNNGTIIKTDLDPTVSDLDSNILQLIDNANTTTNVSNNNVFNNNPSINYDIIDEINNIANSMKALKSKLPSITEVNFDNGKYSVTNIKYILYSMMNIFLSARPATLDELAAKYNMNINDLRDDLAYYVNNLYSTLSSKYDVQHTTAKEKVIFIESNLDLNSLMSTCNDPNMKTLIENIIKNAFINRHNNSNKFRVSNVDVSRVLGFNTNNYDSYKSKIVSKLKAEGTIIQYADETSLKYTAIERMYLDSPINEIEENRILTKDDIKLMRKCGIVLDNDYKNIKNKIIKKLVKGIKNLITTLSEDN